MKIDLAKVIGYSKDCLQSREKMRAIMRDLYPDSTLETNVLLSVYESGIPKIIRNNKTISNAQYTSYIQKIIDAYGIHEKYVIEGLNAWIDYCIGSGAVQNLQLTYTPSKTKIQNNTYSFPDMGLNPKESIAFSSPNISCYPIKNQVSGDQSDYDIVDLGNGQIEITKFKGFEEKTMIIPNKIQGKNVIGIGKEAYLGCKIVEKIIISEGIKYIENRAFYRCSELSEVVFPDSLERIGTKPSKRDHLYRLHAAISGAFYNTALKKIILPSNLTFVGAGSFYECDSLTKITFPDSLKTIEAKAFYKCRNLKTVEMNEGLEIIKNKRMTFPFIEDNHLYTRRINLNSVNSSDLTNFNVDETYVEQCNGTVCVVIYPVMFINKRFFYCLHDIMVMGVDLGVNTDATCAIYDNSTGKCVLKQIRLHVKDKILQLQNQYKHTNNKETKESLRREIQALNGEYRQELSKKICQYAVDNKVEFVFLEGLQKISSKYETEIFWNPQRVLQEIYSELHRAGIAYRSVSAVNTSRYYAKGGYVERHRNNYSRATAPDGRIIDADANAAKNIVARGMMGLYFDSIPEDVLVCMLKKQPVLLESNKIIFRYFNEVRKYVDKKCNTSKITEQKREFRRIKKSFCKKHNIR